MSSRYMNYLRKNAKVVLVVMGIVCMITFVVGTALIDLASSARHAAQNPNPVVVTWTKGNVRTDELGVLQFRHSVAKQFLARVVSTAVQRGGNPIINGRPAIANQQIMEIGIPQDDSEETAVQTVVLAEEARRMGVTVDRDGVKGFLRQISSPELREGDWYELAHEVVANRNISVNQLLEHLAFELQAHHVRMLAMSGLYAQGVGPIVPPGQAYELFCRVNRRYAIEAFPVDVQPLVAEVKGEPSQAELQKLFDEGKYRNPDPNVDEPGFHRPHKLAFKYLTVSFAPFLEEAKKQITDEQIAEAYEKDISQGLHKVQELPPETSTPEEKKEAEQPAAEKPADAPAPEKPTDNPTETPAEKPDNAKNEKSGCDTDDPPAATTQQPAEVKTADTKPTDDKPTDDKPAEKTEDQPRATDPAAAPKETKYKPLSEVREEILKRLAQPIAEEARKKAEAEVVAAIEKFGKAYRRYQDVKSFKKSADIEDPGKLELAPLAAKYSFPIGETPLVDRHEVATYEIGQKVQQIDMQALQVMRQIRMLSFADIAFSQDDPLYKPETARSSEPDVNYIYFRTAEEKPADVTLKDVQAQVVEFWKRRQAFELAMEQAKKLTEKAKDVSSLAEVAPDATKVVTTPPFAWLTTAGFGFQQPELSQVQGIELAGVEFMKGVFSLKPGESGVAPNQAHTKVYVVRAVSQEPDDERLRSQFLEQGYNNMVLMLAQNEALQTSVEWYRGIADQYKVKWQRPPEYSRRTSDL